MAATVVSSEAPPDLDQRIVLRDVSWEQYEALLALFGDDPPGIRMAYLEGALEIMSPSRKHETIKTVVGRLIEFYALERGISLTGLGSTTFRHAAKEQGIEPDECYCVGEDKEFPDIAFEVVLTSGGGVNRLAIYAGLGVAEVVALARRNLRDLPTRPDRLRAPRAERATARTGFRPARVARRDAGPNASPADISGRLRR